MTNQNRIGSSIRTQVAAAALAAAGLVSPMSASAQNPLGDGHALDANLSTTTRYNQPRQGFLLNRINDAIVTGTAAGGKSFRGIVGYTSPFAFRGQTSASSQFDFERDSIYSGMATRRGAPRNPGIQGAYQVPGLSRGGSPSAVNPIGANVLTPMSGANLQDIARARYGSSLPSLEATASVQQFRPMRDLTATAQNAYGASPYQNSLTPSTLASITTIDPLLDRGSLQAASATGALTQPNLTGLGLGAASGNDLSANSATRNALTRGIDRTFDGVAFREGWSNRIAGQSAASSSAATPLLAGQDSYADYIARLSARNPATGLPQPGQPYSDETKQTMREFSRDYLGIDAAVSAAPDALDDALRGPIASLTDDELTQLSRPMPAISNLAGDNSSQFADHVRLAQTALSEGRYFDAESWFDIALYYTPDHPLAMAGRVNAQLGAGKYRSAALGLRRLFEAHPELINTRYESNLLPTPERLGAIATELQGMFSQDGTTVEAGLLLAYVGHLTNQADLIVAGLDELKARQPDDALTAVLRRIWLQPPSKP